MSGPIRITADQRDALYDLILDRLSAVGDLWMVIEGRRFQEVDKLSREICDDLLFVNEDLGWGDGDGEEVELTTPPDVLRRVMSRHFQDALLSEANEIAERDETCRDMREGKERNQGVIGACRRVLAELDLAEAHFDSAEL